MNSNNQVSRKCIKEKSNGTKIKSIKVYSIVDITRDIVSIDF